AIEKVDDDFLAHARDLDEAPLLARPCARHANVARAVLVLLALLIPEELHLHAPVFINENLFAGRTDDDGGLRTPDDRLRRQARRAIVDRGWDGDERLRKGVLGARGRGAGAAVRRRVVGRQDEVLFVRVAAIEIRDLHLGSAGDGGADRGARDGHVRRLLLFHAHARQVLAVAHRPVFARIVVELEAGVVHARERGGRLLQ